MIVYKCFPIWDLKKVEQYLSDMAKKGLRLSTVKFSHFYVFTKEKCSNVKYIVTYNITRDTAPNMYEYEYKLLSEYNAQRIKTDIFTGFNYFRICNCNDCFEELKEFRSRYLIRKCKLDIATALLLFLMFAVFIALAFFLKAECKFENSIIAMCAMALFPLIIVLRKLFCIYKLKQK